VSGEVSFPPSLVSVGLSGLGLHYSSFYEVQLYGWFLVTDGVSALRSLRSGDQ